MEHGIKIYRTRQYFNIKIQKMYTEHGSISTLKYTEHGNISTLKYTGHGSISTLKYA